MFFWRGSYCILKSSSRESQLIQTRVKYFLKLVYLQNVLQIEAVLLRRGEELDFSSTSRQPAIPRDDGSRPRSGNREKSDPRL